MTEDNASAPPSLVIEGHEATIRLNRPRQHNRLEPDDLLVLMGMFEAIDADRAIRVVTITAAGKSFSSGFNIGDLGQARAKEIPDFEAVVNRLEALRAPVICALNGGVYGGSTDLALACDFRLGVTGMQFRMPAAGLGLHYYPGGLRRYVSRLGLSNAKRLFLLAETVGAEELLRLGYLDEVLAPEDLMPRAKALATRLAGNAPLAVQGTKLSLNDIARGVADNADLAARAKAVSQSADFKEGRAAWLEKRVPVFRGE